MIANAPSDGALFRIKALFRLTLDALLHNVVAADSTVVDGNVPAPKGNS